MYFTFDTEKRLFRRSIVPILKNNVEDIFTKTGSNVTKTTDRIKSIPNKQISVTDSMFDDITNSLPNNKEINPPTNMDIPANNNETESSSFNRMVEEAPLSLNN